MIDEIDQIIVTMIDHDLIVSITNWHSSFLASLVVTYLQNPFGSQLMMDCPSIIALTISPFLHCTVSRTLASPKSQIV